MNRAGDRLLGLRSDKISSRQNPFKFSTVLLFYAITGYAQRILVALCAILAIALSMDLVNDWDQITRTAKDGESATARVALFLALSVVDRATNLLAIAVFLGVVWWELRHTQLRERMIVWTGGQSPLQSLAAPLLLAIVVVWLQLWLDLRIRPVVLGMQMDAHLGVIGERYDRRLSSRFSWAKVGSDIMSARIDYGPPTVLYDLTVYKLTEKNDLFAITKARRALQTPTDGVWRLEEPVHLPIRYAFAYPKEYAREEDSDRIVSGKADTERLVLKLDPRMFKLQDIAAKYLPQSVLRELAAQEGYEPPVSDYKTWLHFRYARGFFTGLMVLLATTVALFGGMGRPRSKYGIIFLSGYAAYSLVKLLTTMGELGFLVPVVAVWTGPLLILLLIVSLQTMISRKLISVGQ